MRKIKEILRLGSLGLGARAIARATGSGRTSVKKYISAAKRVGLSWEEAQLLNDMEIESRLCPVEPKESADTSEGCPEVARSFEETAVVQRLSVVDTACSQAAPLAHGVFCSRHGADVGARGTMVILETMTALKAPLPHDCIHACTRLVHLHV